MSRKDYVKLAAAIRETLQRGGDGPTVICLAREVADVLAADNPRFDRDRFLRAAGL